MSRSPRVTPSDPVASSAMSRSPRVTPSDTVASSAMRRAAAWGLFGVYLALSAACVGFVVVQDASPDSLGALWFAGFAGAGVLIALRRPGNAVGWILLGTAIFFAFGEAAEAYVAADHPGRLWVGWLSTFTTNVWFSLALIFLPLLFPDGHLPSPRWRAVVWLGVIQLLLGVVSGAFSPGELELRQSAGLENPLGVDGGLPELAGVASVFMGGVAVVLAAASIVVRLRRARGVKRQQLKWFAYVGVLAAACLSVAVFVSAITGAESDGTYYVAVVCWLSGLALVGIGLPIATGLAILRHRLYDIDVVIRRTIVYGALTATLAATYLALVLLSGLTLGSSNLAIAVSTLAVAALFRPALRRIQGAVDRRFYRRRYDAARTLEEFGTRLRDELDLETLGADLRGVVTDTMQPAHVSLWLRGGP